MRIELLIISLICAILVLILIPLQWKTRNVATLSLVIWLAVCNVIRVINSAIWAGNMTVKHQLWCDISKCLITCCADLNTTK